MTKVLVTGGAGYIGSHASAILCDQGHEVVVYDNLSTGHLRLVPQEAEFVEGDTRDTTLLVDVLRGTNAEAVMHFAASALVQQSMERPVAYYDNNILGTASLVEAMVAAEVRNLVFSSTCAVYGESSGDFIHESSPVAPINPYGLSKFAAEMAIGQRVRTGQIVAAILRYFNVAGADCGARRGELHEYETHLVPLLLNAAAQSRPVSVFGDDYPTPDGSCIRDYVHVVDLVEAHVLALAYLTRGGGSCTVNLGTGRGSSVLEMVAAAETVTGRVVEVRLEGRRPGDPARLVASNRGAKDLLGWSPTRSEPSRMLADAWRWHGTAGFPFEVNS